MVDRRHGEEHQRGADEHRRADPRGGVGGEADQHDPGGQRQRGGGEVQPAAQLRLERRSSVSAASATESWRLVHACTHRVARPGCSCREGTRRDLTPSGRMRRTSPDRLVTIVQVADWKRGLRRVIYPVYEARVLRRMPDNLPKHVGVMLDGNRRWAQSVGRDSAHGHQAGADNIEPLLGWCDEVGIEVVTLWLLSTDNLNRPPAELTQLLEIIEAAVESLAERRRWRLHPVGALDLLPSSTAAEAQGRRGGHPRRRRDAGQHRGRRTAAAARSPTPSGPCSASTPAAAPRSRSSPRSSTSSTSPSTSTPRASPTPTW